jgi:hypothetical protein
MRLFVRKLICLRIWLSQSSSTFTRSGLTLPQMVSRDTWKLAVFADSYAAGTQELQPYFNSKWNEAGSLFSVTTTFECPCV